MRLSLLSALLPFRRAGLFPDCLILLLSLPMLAVTGALVETCKLTRVRSIVVPGWNARTGRDKPATRLPMRSAGGLSGVGHRSILYPVYQHLWQ